MAWTLSCRLAAPYNLPMRLRVHSDLVDGTRGADVRGAQAPRVLFVVGTAMFFSIAITQVMMPTMFFSNGRFDMGDDHSFDALATLVLLLSTTMWALGYLLLRSYRLTTRRREVVFLLIVSVLTGVLQLALMSGTLEPLAAEAGRWVYLLGLSASIVWLSTVWAGNCDFFDGRELRILIPLAMLLSVGFGVGSRMLGQALDLGPGTVQAFLPQVSAVVGAAFLSSVAKASATCGPADEPEYTEFSPTGQAHGAWSLLVAWVVMGVFLFGTAAFVSYYSQGLRLDALQGSSHIATVLILSLCLILVARLAEKRLLRFQVTIVLFVAFCLIALYCTAMVGATFTAVAKNVLLPARACAIFLSWLILEEFCRERNAPFAPLAGIAFFPMVLSAKLVTVGAWPFLSAAVLSGQDHTVLMAACLVTAFLVTIGAFFVVRYGWSEDRGLSEAAAGGDVAGLGAGGGADGRDDVERDVPGFGTAGLGVAAGLDGEAAWPTGGVSQDDSTDAGQGTSTEDEERRALELIRIRYGLTNREFDVLRLTAAGHTQKGMANELYLSVNSVSTYVKALHAKLGVHSKQEIIDLVQRTRVGRK